MSEQSKILIVDDKPENLYSMQKLLQKLDVGIYTAQSGNDALSMILDHEFCMAIVDVQMPEMDGYELVDIIRSDPSTANLPIIFVSAIYSDEYHHRKGYDAGAVDFLSKPFVPEILLSKIKVFLSLYEQRMQLANWSRMLEQTVEQRTNELAQANARLARLDRAKSDFIQIAAHELRTPLTVIKGYINMLQGSSQDSAQVQNLLQGMNTGSERMLEIINSMLDISRIDTQVLKVLPERISLADLFAKLKTSLQGPLNERQITLGLEGLDELPDLNADPDLVYKLFYQLVVNAIKFTPDGGFITVYGQASVDWDTPQVEIQVIDSGIGVAPENHEIIFEKFFQLSPAKLHTSGKYGFKSGGPGLGLAVAKGIVDAHGGRIWVESPVNDAQSFPGSIFHVALPLNCEE